ncbi:hypothetical protein LTR17_009543 [Elasticomyces elasticus]|nr:hypothetical protein LTR17_009543 [Elasticomyces elasticus]
MTEKANQVSLMRNIYQQAERVYVWLGEEEEAADDAADDANFGVESVTKPFISEADYLNLLMLGKRAWWYRLWVMQEAALANDVVVCLGSRTCDWDQFMGFMEMKRWLGGRLGPNKQVREDAYARIVRVDRLRRSVKSDTTLSLLLATSIGTYCSEPRDSIIGLLGLTSRNTRASIGASYDMAPTALFATACLHIINETQSLDVLVDRWPRPNHGTQDRASWLPDFAKQVRGNSFLYTTRQPSLIDKQDNKFVSSRIAYASGHTVASIVRNPAGGITLEAILIGSVSCVQKTDTLSPPADKINGASPTDRTNVAYSTVDCVARTILPFVSGTTTASSTRDFWRTFDMGFVDLLMTGIIKRPTEDSYAMSRLIPRPQWVDYYDWDRGVFVEEMLYHHLTEARHRPGRYYDEHRTELQPEVIDWAEQVNKIITNRLVFRTDDRYIGLANAGIQEGDIAIVPFGASVPFLLRKVPKSTSYRLVDGCAIHGVINGELMHAHQRGTLQAKFFDIV